MRVQGVPSCIDIVRRAYGELIFLRSVPAEPPLCAFAECLRAFGLCAAVCLLTAEHEDEQMQMPVSSVNSQNPIFPHSLIPPSLPRAGEIGKYALIFSLSHSKSGRGATYAREQVSSYRNGIAHAGRSTAWSSTKLARPRIPDNNSDSVSRRRIYGLPY